MCASGAGLFPSRKVEEITMSTHATRRGIIATLTLSTLVACTGFAALAWSGSVGGLQPSLPPKQPKLPGYPTHPTPPGKKDAPSSEARVPKVVVLKLHADWCDACKKMGSMFEDLTAKFDEEPVLFITLDLTDSSTRSRAELMIGALGYGELWDDLGAGKKTGQLAIIGHKGKKLVEMFEPQTITGVESRVKDALDK